MKGLEYIHLLLLMLRLLGYPRVRCSCPVTFHPPPPHTHTLNAPLILSDDSSCLPHPQPH